MTTTLGFALGAMIGVWLHRLITVVWYGLDALSLYLKSQRDHWHNIAKMAERDRR